MTKELVYIQDLLKKTEEVNENTLLAELRISIRLFEQDYVDHSTHIEYRTLFGSAKHDTFSIDNPTSSIKFSQKDLTIVNEKNSEAISSRECALSGSLNFQAADASEVKEPSF